MSAPSATAVCNALKQWRKKRGARERDETLLDDPVLTALPFLRDASRDSLVSLFADALRYAIPKIQNPEYVDDILGATLLPEGVLGSSSVRDRYKAVYEELLDRGADITPRTVEHRELDAGLPQLGKLLANYAFAEEFDASRFPDGALHTGTARLTREEEQAILASVVGSRELTTEGMVAISIRDDSNDADRCFLTNRTSCAGPLREYVVAIVRFPELVDRILARCPRINEVWSTGGLPIDEAAPDFLKSCTLLSRAIDDHGVGDPVRHTLERVAAEQMGEFLRGVENEDPDMRLFATTIVPGSTGRTRIVSEFSLALTKARHCCYWIAERAMFVQRITVDYSLFTPGPEGSLRVYPFMANVDTMTLHDAANRRHEILVDNWLVKGHGLMVVWS